MDRDASIVQKWKLLMSSSKITGTPSLSTAPSRPTRSGSFVHYYLILLIVVPSFLGYIVWSAPDGHASALTNAAVSTDVTGCGVELPVVEWLGEGAADYQLPQGFHTFIVKRLPFKFHLEQGQIDATGNRVYRAAAGERVWACQGDCQLPAVYHDRYALGTLQPGTVVNLVVIDDDGPEQNNDQRRNWWARNDPLVPYLIVEEQTMVEYLTLKVPEAGEWYYYANDSIGIAAQCIEPAPTATVTATPTATAMATSTATATATATETPIPATPLPKPSLTATPSATATPSSTTTPSSTPTQTATSTASPTSTATEASTPEGFGTPPVFVTMTMTPTQTVQEPPTALQLVYFTANSHNKAIHLRWETAFELNVVGFQLWRSSNGQRADAQMVSTTLIGGRGTAGTGAAYTFVDSDVRYGVQYTYWLREIDGAGSGVDASATAATLTYQLFVPHVGR